MFLAIIFFTVDLIVYSIFNSPHSYLLISYLIFESVKEVVDNFTVAACVFFMLLWSCVADKIVGINLIYSIPIIILGFLIRKNVIRSSIFMFQLVVIVFVVGIDCFFIKRVLFQQNVSSQSTFLKIFASIISVVLINYLLGFRGSRLRDRMICKRKVWTPNKMDAL
jgi:hypothetical protein